MAEAAPLLQPGEVPIVGPDGRMHAVPDGGAQEAVRLGGRVATPQELQELQYGGLGGEAQAALLGAAETATMGGSTALLAEGGVLAGGQSGRRSVEEYLRNIERTNPLAHTLGEAAPLLLAPEAGGEELAAGLLKSESAMARAARWAAPHFARGAVETAAIEGSQGISEDLLDHDLAAESFYVHAMKPETLYGGLLNVGVAGGFKGLGKLTSSMGRQAGGRVGEIAANDALLFDDVVRSVQAAGGTSDEAAAAIRDVQSLASRRAALPAESRAMVDSGAEALIKAHAGGNADKARQLTRIYRDGVRVAETLDDEMTGLARQADTHLTAIANDMAEMERGQFGLKQQNIQQLADPTRIQAAADAANSWLRELRATITPLELPPPPRMGKVPKLEALEKRYLKDPTLTSEQAKQFALAEHTAVARQAEETLAREMAAHEAEVARLTAERAQLIDPEIQRLIGYDPATRVGVANKDLRALQKLLLDSQREIAAAVKQGGQEGASRLFTVIDDSKRVVGKYAKFGTENHAAAKQLERYLYQNRLQPMLEDSNLWGSRLAEMQAETNKAFHESFDAVTGLRNRFMGSLESPNGARRYTPKGDTKGFLERLGTYENGFDEQLVSRAADAARTRGAAMLKTMELPAATRAAIERAGQNAAELEKLLEKARTTASDAREIKALKAREGSGGPGGIVGKLLGFATSPAQSLQMLGQFRAAETEVRKLLARESTGFLKGEAVPPVKPMLQGAERKAAIQSIRDVQRYQTDPRALAVAIKDTLGDMPNASPQMASAVATTIARGVLALAKRAPQPLPPRFTEKPGEERYASGELERYWRDKQLVERPPVVMQLMRSGQLHQEDITLMKEVIPRLFAQMQMQLELDVQKARESGGLRTMTYQEQIALSWMLGRPLDATQDPSFVAAMQQSAMNDPMNQAAFGKAAMGGGRPSKANNVNLEQYKTLQEQLEA